MKQEWFPDDPFATSFPEPESFNGADNRPLPSVNRSQKGDVHRRIKERDCHDLWAALRTFRAQYGEEALQQVIRESKS